MEWVIIPVLYMKEQRLGGWERSHSWQVTKLRLKPLIHLTPGPHSSSIASRDSFNGFLHGPLCLFSSHFKPSNSEARLIFLKLAFNHVTPFFRSPTSYPVIWKCPSSGPTNMSSLPPKVGTCCSVDVFLYASLPSTTLPSPWFFFSKYHHWFLYIFNTNWMPTNSKIYCQEAGQLNGQSTDQNKSDLNPDSTKY